MNGHSKPSTFSHIDISLPGAKWMDRHRMTRASLTAAGPPDTLLGSVYYVALCRPFGSLLTTP